MKLITMLVRAGILPVLSYKSIGGCFSIFVITLIISLQILTKKSYNIYNIFLRFHSFIFKERGREAERERNIYVWLPLTHPLLGTCPPIQACALTGN